MNTNVYTAIKSKIFPFLIVTLLLLVFALALDKIEWNGMKMMIVTNIASLFILEGKLLTFQIFFSYSLKMIFIKLKSTSFLSFCINWLWLWIGFYFYAILHRYFFLFTSELYWLIFKCNFGKFGERGLCLKLIGKLKEKYKKIPYIQILQMHKFSPLWFSLFFFLKQSNWQYCSLYP